MRKIIPKPVCCLWKLTVRQQLKRYVCCTTVASRWPETFRIPDSSLFDWYLLGIFVESSVSSLISDSDIRKDYIKLPLIHKLIRGEKISSLLEKTINVKSQQVTKNVKSENKKSGTIFSFCPGCGFDNSKQFKFCPQCGSTLSSK